MNKTPKMLIDSIYSPPLTKGAGTCLEDFYKTAPLSFYSFARHALLAGLRNLGLKKGDKILVPSFICRDVLAPLNVLELEVIFYSVDENLKLASQSSSLPKAAAILVLHYFGFTTDLQPYLEYCKKHQAFLIEDNAHGLWSANEQGAPLGTQGDMGIVSLRKSLPIENGAMLISSKNRPLVADTIFQGHQSIRLKVKNLLRPLVAQGGYRWLLMLTGLKRKLRAWVKGQEIPVSGDEDEFVIPGPSAPVNFFTYVSQVAVDQEKARRQELFHRLLHLLRGQPVRFLRAHLAKNEVPYGFPFFCSPSEITRVREFLLRHGLEVVSWPALPKMVLQAGVPDYYKNLYLVKFLW